MDKRDCTGIAEKLIEGVGGGQVIDVRAVAPENEVGGRLTGGEAFKLQPGDQQGLRIGTHVILSIV